uniref:Uncharacterized protein n=1 Tax=Anguilla anguilla TaxID=7936 RepID=A0A0E9RM61_ANGAN
MRSVSLRMTCRYSLDNRYRRSFTSLGRNYTAIYNRRSFSKTPQFTHSYLGN